MDRMRPLHRTERMARMTGQLRKQTALTLVSTAALIWRSTRALRLARRKLSEAAK